MTDRWDELNDARLEHEPWWARYIDDPSEARAALHAELDGRPGYNVDASSFIAHGAHVVASTFTIGARSTIASGCSIRGEIVIGDDSALNPGVVTIGRVTIGDAARIASYAVLVGENHEFGDLDARIMDQRLTSLGIVIDDDVWIGANVTVVDGVHIGAHSVIAAGAVVTHDVAPYSVMGGVPARLIRDRRIPRPRPNPKPRSGPGSTGGLARFDAIVSATWSDVLERCRVTRDTEQGYVDTPGGDPESPRPLNDAIEIAAMFGAVPPIAPREQLIARIRATQDPTTGAFVDRRVGPVSDPLTPSPREWDMYGYLSSGYALEVLGSGPEHLIRIVEDCTTEQLTGLLDGLDQDYLAWPSGSWVDGFGTALYLNRVHHGSRNTAPALWDWLSERQHRTSGMWGRHLEPVGQHDLRWLMAVNGFYRLARGTYAQFGVDVPNPEASIDTVLAHGRQWDWFATNERNACNLLDVVHPLWLLGRQTEYRRDDIRDVIAALLNAILMDWVAGQGFAWQIGRDSPGLQGTEMFLSVVFIAADILGESEGLSFVPRGVHRLAPATDLA